MPLNVSIAINGRPLQYLHIGRLSGTTDSESLNTYAVVVSSDPTGSRISNDDWMDAPRFEHRYGDGALTCVQKGIQAYLPSS